MGIECFVDADFAGGWSIITSADADNVMSPTGFVITYANCPIYWASCPQTEIRRICTKLPKKEHNIQKNNKLFQS
jgi:hypothetical protein